MEDIILAIQQFKVYIQTTRCEKDGSRITNESASRFVANMNDLEFCEVLRCSDQIRTFLSI